MVTDPTGAAIPSASVVAKRVDTGITTEVKSNESGEYVFPSLAPATYDITVTASGFSTQVHNNVVLLADASVTTNVALSVGATSQTLTVEAAPVTVDTTTGTLSQVVDTKQVNELPLNGRNAASLTTLVAGVVVAPSGASDQGNQKTFPVVVNISANGTRANQTNYLLDGGNNVDEYTNVNAPFPFPDALQEFSVQTSNYAAQYGQNAGGVVNVITKSGTNQFHGNLFEYVRNAVFNGANYFGYFPVAPGSQVTAKTRDPLKRNQFGGTVGGPIFRNKSFFFFGYQKTIIRTQAQSSSSSTVPTAAQLAGHFSSTVYDPATCTGATFVTCTPFANNTIPTSRYNPVSLALLKYLPQGDANGTVYTRRPTAQDFNEYVGRNDNQIGSKDHLTVRYYYNSFGNNAVLDPTNLLTYSDGSYIRYMNSLVSEAHSFSSNVLNNLIVSYQREESKRGPAAGAPSAADLGVNIWQPAFKQINGIGVSGFFSIGDNPQGVFGRANYTYSDDVAWIHGNHTMAFGAHAETSKIDITNQFQQPGVFTFNANQTNNAMASFLMGYMDEFKQGSGQLFNNRAKFLGFYAQDTWKVSRRLTLDYGVRYEPFLPQHEKMNRMGQFNPAAYAAGRKSTMFPNAPVGLLFAGDQGVPVDGIRPVYTNFMPRVGFAFDVFGDGKTALRGGGGMFYDTRPDGAFNNAYTSGSPFVTFVDILYRNPYFTGNTTGNFQNPYAGIANPFPAPPPSSSAVFPTQSYITFDPSGNFQVPLVYNWNLAVEQQMSPGLVARIAYVATHASHIFASVDINPVVPAAFGGTGKRVYPLYTNQITQTSMVGNTTYNSLQATLEQRLQHGLTILANYTWSKALDDLPVNTAVTSAGAGNSYVLPTYLPNYKVLDYGPSDFDHRNVVSLSYVYATPEMHEGWRPLRYLVNGWQTSGIVQFRSGDPLTVTSGVDNSGTGLGRDRGVLVGMPYGSQACATATNTCKGYLNPAAFTKNPTGTFGNIKKGSFVGPQYMDWDMGVQRFFKVTERAQFQFRAEFFNVLNHTNFGDPTASLSSSSFGKITGTNGDPRIGQMSLKLAF